jgi:hypothetical protein
MVDLIGDASPVAYALIIQQTRRIGTIVPDIVVEEVHDDVMQITKHPVETGAPINDHAFRMPSVIQMKLGYSNSKHQSVNYVKTAYEKLLKAMGDREPMTVVTGKRTYRNMLISHIHVSTDSTSEYALNAVVGLEEVIFANVETIPIPVASEVGTTMAGMFTSINLGEVNPILTGG